MSALADDPHHFVRWARANGLAADDSAYPRTHPARPAVPVAVPIPAAR